MGKIELLLIVLIALAAYAALKKDKPDIVSHWHHLVDDFTLSTNEFYSSIVQAIKSHHIPDAETTDIEFPEGGVFSANRAYLRVIRKEHIFDICAAPFGTGFFVSWWLGKKSNDLIMLINKIPLLGPLLIRTFRPETYYRLDTALMFQEIVHAAVIEVLDQATKAKGLRCLSEQERKPIMKDLFKR